MPNKTIYVSEEDLALFERAQEATGENLSATIVRALRQYLDRQSARRQGFYEVTVEVGGSDAPRYKRFSGARVGRGRRENGDGNLETFDVYRTPKEHFVLHTRRMPSSWRGYQRREDDGSGDDWRGWDASQWSSWRSSWRGAADWSQWETGSESSVDVFDSVDAMQQVLPAELLEKVRTASEDPLIEVLDL